MTPDTDVTTAEKDLRLNALVRELATQSPAEPGFYPQLLKVLYEHSDLMKAELLAGELPPVIFATDVQNVRTIASYRIFRDGSGVRWRISFNTLHLRRPMYEVLATLLHELLHAWQHKVGTPGKPPHHNAEFRNKAAELGIPTDARGHYQPPVSDSPFHAYCLRHGVAWEAPPTPEEHPWLPGPVLKPAGSKMKKWSCRCTNIRAAVELDVTCNKCDQKFVRQG